jgi:hypothetical protein
MIHTGLAPRARAARAAAWCVALVGLAGLAFLWLRAVEREPARREASSSTPAAERETPRVPAGPLADPREAIETGSAPVQVPELPPESPATAAAPLRTLAGTLLDGAGEAVEDVPLALLRDGEAVAETRTQFTGRFVFPPVPEGEYELVVGDPLGPLLQRRPLALDARAGELELVVPVLLELEVRVVDEQGLAVPGAPVEGTGESGLGRLAGETDSEGRFLARQLPPGNYRVFASHPDLGRGNRITVLSAHARDPLEIRLLTGRPDPPVPR